MRDVKEKFKSYSLFKKVLFFNAYAIALGVCYQIIMFIIFPLIETLFDDIEYIDSLILYFKDFSSYLQSALWGYTMAILALFTPIFSRKEKK